MTSLKNPSGFRPDTPGPNAQGQKKPGPLTRYIDSVSLRTKSILLMTLASFMALIFASAVYVGYELVMFRSSAENESRSISRIVGLNSMASLAFRDDDAARETLLSVISRESSIIHAALYDQYGKLFTQVSNQQGRDLTIPPHLDMDVDSPHSPVIRWQGAMLTVLHPIFQERSRAGYVRLVMTQPTLMRQLTIYLGMSVCVLLASILLAYIFSLFSQRFITMPVLELQGTMEHVAVTGDYSIRARTASKDELGQLAQGFNEMLGRIQGQDNELRSHRERLEENVRSRTRELSEANQILQRTVGELRLARDRAEAANQAKMQFLANISHEIRTPMNGVLGVAEILDHSPLSDRQRQLLQALRQSGADMMVIINDLLDFSKLEAGKFSLHISTFNLHQLLDNCITAFAPQARAKALELVCITSPEVPALIQSDPDRLRQILVNLIGNALKFTASGSIVLNVSLEEEEGTQGWLLISVRDTGIGIPAAALDKIFSPFTQADETMTRTHGGTGLGLTIVHQLLGLLEGSISVHSTEGHGSEFIVRIPFIHPERGGEENPPSYAGISIHTCGLTPLSRVALDNMLGRYSLVAVHYDCPQDCPPAHDGGKRIIFVEGSSHAEAEVILSQLRQRQTDCHNMVLISSDLSAAADNLLLMADKAIAKPIRQSGVQQILQDAAGVRTGEEAASEIVALGATYSARALLVEDNKVNQSVARAALELFGLEPTIADNGLDALNLLQNNRFDIIFMDCQMPVMDGYTASARIREQERLAGNGRRIPIVAMTAHALDKDRKRCFQSGMDAYLPKPFTLEALGKCLAEWLPDRAQAMDLPSAVLSGGIPAGTQEDALDPQTLASLRKMQSMGSSDLLHTLFDAYTSSAQELMQAIEKAMGQSNWRQIREHAHTLKSSSHNVGATTLSRLARDMEILAMNEDVPEITALYPVLLQEHQKVLLAVARQKEEL